MRTIALCLGVLVAICVGTVICDLPLKAESVSVFAVVPGLSGFTTDNDGTIYALSGTENRIVRLGPDGRILGSIGPLLEGGYSLQISRLCHPVHVDASGYIYIESKGYLFLLDTAGHVLNVDSDGKRINGFEVGSPSWIGTTRRGDIFVHPAINDENSLISVITPEGTRLPDFGDAIFPQGMPDNLFRVTMTENDTLYAVLSQFPAMLKYRPDQSFDSLIKLRLGKGLEQVIDSQDMSIEDAIQALSKHEPIRINHTIFTDAESASENTLVCVSSAQILWYSESGRLLRQLDQIHLWASTGARNVITNVTAGCDGHCLLGRVQFDDKIYRIDF
jgi:hypothetical protein